MATPRRNANYYKLLAQTPQIYDKKGELLPVAVKICKQIGISPQQMVQKTEEDFQLEVGPPELKKIKYENYERRRQKKIQLIKNLILEAKNQEAKEFMNHSGNSSIQLNSYYSNNNPNRTFDFYNKQQNSSIDIGNTISDEKKKLVPQIDLKRKSPSLNGNNLLAKNNLVVNKRDSPANFDSNKDFHNEINFLDASTPFLTNISVVQNQARTTQNKDQQNLDFHRASNTLIPQSNNNSPRSISVSEVSRVSTSYNTGRKQYKFDSQESVIDPNALNYTTRSKLVRQLISIQRAVKAQNHAMSFDVSPNLLLEQIIQKQNQDHQQSFMASQQKREQQFQEQKSARTQQFQQIFDRVKQKQNQEYNERIKSRQEILDSMKKLENDKEKYMREESFKGYSIYVQRLNDYNQLENQKIKEHENIVEQSCNHLSDLENIIQLKNYQRDHNYYNYVNEIHKKNEFWTEKAKENQKSFQEQLDQKQQDVLERLVVCYQRKGRPRDLSNISQRNKALTQNAQQKRIQDEGKLKEQINEISTKYKQKEKLASQKRNELMQNSVIYKKQITNLKFNEVKENRTIYNYQYVKFNNLFNLLKIKNILAQISDIRAVITLRKV